VGILNEKDGKQIAKVDIKAQWIARAAISSDAQAVAIIVHDHPGRIELRRVPDLSEIGKIEPPSSASAVEFSHSGKLLAASLADSTILVWKIDRLAKPKPKD
jgi:WD40 repeat protein